MESLHTKTDTKCHPQPPVKRQKNLQRRFVWTGGGTKLCKTLRRKDFHVPLHNTSPVAIFKCSSRNILYNMLYAVLILCFSCQNVLSQTSNCPSDTPCFPDSENLALEGAGRNLDVSSMCGSNGVTTYTKSVLLLDNTQFQCDATNDTSKHPKEYMVDTVTEQITLTAGSAPVSYETANAITYWQSDNSITDNNGVPSDPEIEWIVLNLTDPFLIRYIRIVYVSPHVTGEDAVSDMRPKAICIERKNEPRRCRMAAMEILCGGLCGCFPDCLPSDGESGIPCHNCSLYPKVLRYWQNYLHWNWLWTTRGKKPRITKLKRITFPSFSFGNIWN